MAFNKPAIDMPKQMPEERIHNFDEVAQGYTKELALEEAERCLQCKNPQCIKGCPVNIDIPAFISLIKEEKFIEAAKKIKETNALPAICGRVCPQENQCQKFCIVGIRGEPVEIGRLESFVADYEQNAGVEMPEEVKGSGHKVAVVGGGGNYPQIAEELGELNIRTYITGVTMKVPSYEPSLIFHDICKSHGINVIGATHYSTEKFACIAVQKFFDTLGVPSEFVEDDPSFLDYGE